MHLLLTGVCGFVGSTLAEALLDHTEPGALQITGIDNFSRSGSWLNRDRLVARGIKVLHGDLRIASDLETLGPFDWVIDAAANPSVLAGIDGKSSSRQLVEHNLGGTINLLEACQRWHAGFLLLSTSRVYSIPPLANLDVEVHDHAYRPTVGADRRGDPLVANGAERDCKEPATPSIEQGTKNTLPGLSHRGISETFSTAPPVSLYGATKLTSETLALEYGLTFDFPVWINRCGVLAGARQFGKPDQGIFAFWIHSWREGRPLKFIGFDGLGHQVRDCLHPRDLAPLILKQVGIDRCRRPASSASSSPPLAIVGPPTSSAPSLACSQLSAFPRVVNLSGGLASAMSLRQLSDWCADRFSSAPVTCFPTSDLRPRPFDLPWVVLDHSLASQFWNWQPTTTVDQILGEIAAFATRYPDWIATSA